MSEMPVISIEGIHKSFGKKEVLHDVSITVQAGEVFGFLGPNGAGKSTTIRILLGALYPTSGRVTLFSKADYTNPSVHAKIGYLAGDMVLDEDLTGKQYLQFVAAQYGKNCDTSIDELAKLLQADLHKKIGTYSRGNRQKIGLIAALMHQPELLVLDEPTSGFDPLIQEEFMRLIRQFASAGGTVFMSSHILSEVQQLCDRVAFIKDGQIVAVKRIQELEAKARKYVRLSAPAKTITTVAGVKVKPKGLQLQRENDTVLAGTYAGNIQELTMFLSRYAFDDVIIREPDLDHAFMMYYEQGDTA